MDEKIPSYEEFVDAIVKEFKEMSSLPEKEIDDYFRAENFDYIYEKKVREIQEGKSTLAQMMIGKTSAIAYDLYMWLG